MNMHSIAIIVGSEDIYVLAAEGSFPVLSAVSGLCNANCIDILACGMQLLRHRFISSHDSQYPQL